MGAKAEILKWADPKDPARRSLLNWLLGSSVFAFIAATLYPVLRFLYPTSAGQAFAKEWVEVASMAEIPVKVGAKKVAYANKPVWIIQPFAGDWRAYSAICTHLGCIVNWFPDRQQLISPCHNGIFDINGNVVSGPPPRPLPKYKIEVKGDKVYVGGLMEGEKL
ncbi:MAG: ubiquinol-cytochrome c reductase iron-sulfur subunit [candidate division NC10 bacterium]|nr:ubiquinol-cytochrome c reductase iron-sulfur subunit [candidate division NC10 bacterium]